MFQDLTFKDYAEIAEAILTSLGILAAAFWAIRRFIYSPRIEMAVDVEFAGKQNGYWVAELLCRLENKGHVPYTIRSLRFDLKTLLKSDQVREGDDVIRAQLDFPHALKSGSWTPVDIEAPAVIHPGVKMCYAYVQGVQEDTSFVLLHGVLDYGNRGLQTRADVVRKVPSDEARIGEQGSTNPVTNRCS